jgi:hypothetical protein
MNTNEQRVREFAYQIWESEGRPLGRSDKHWAMACKLAASQEVSSQVESVPASEPAQALAVTPPRKSRAKLAADAPAKSLIDTGPIAMDTPSDTASKAVAKKPSKPKKSKAAENESA